MRHVCDWFNDPSRHNLVSLRLFDGLSEYGGRISLQRLILAQRMFCIRKRESIRITDSRLPGTYFLGAEMASPCRWVVLGDALKCVPVRPGVFSVDTRREVNIACLRR